LTDIVGAVELQKKITPEILKRIEDTLQTRPIAPFDARKFASLAPRR